MTHSWTIVHKIDFGWMNNTWSRAVGYFIRSWWQQSSDDRQKAEQHKILHVLLQFYGFSNILFSMSGLCATKNCRTLCHIDIGPSWSKVRFFTHFPSVLDHLSSVSNIMWLVEFLCEKAASFPSPDQSYLPLYAHMSESIWWTNYLKPSWAC